MSISQASPSHCMGVCKCKGGVGGKKSRRSLRMRLALVYKLTPAVLWNDSEQFLFSIRA